MLFAIGTKVRLKHTGDQGEVTQMLADGMLNVWIPAQEMEIPIFEEDLIREQDYKAPAPKVKKTTPSATPTPSEKVVQYAPPASTDNYSTFKSQGVQLAFDPKYDIDGRTTHYEVFLLNDAATEFIFSIKRNLPTPSATTTHGKLTAHSSFQLDNLLFDQLNDTPIFDIECWEVTTAGTGNKQQKSLKIKAKQFFKKVNIAPLLDRAVHLYVLFENAAKKIKKEEDLKAYTQKNVRPVQYQKSGNDKYNVHDVKEYANFSGEIDLHIENLPSRKGKMSSSEKLQLQLDHFEQYIDKAIRLGVPRIYVIHGIGKGKLRNMIASRLIQMPEVKTFKNEYHPRYGWGATEVIF